MPSFSRSCTRKDAATQITATQNTKHSPKACSCWPEFSCDQEFNAGIAHCVNFALHCFAQTFVSDCRRYTYMTDIRDICFHPRLSFTRCLWRTVLWVPEHVLSQLLAKGPGVRHSSYSLENKFAPIRSNHVKPFRAVSVSMQK